MSTERWRGGPVRFPTATILALAWVSWTLSAATPAPDAAEPLEPVPFESTYIRLPAPPTLIENATVLTGTGQRLEHTAILLAEGRIAALGQGLTPPADAVRIDATGKWVTPGIIDVHTHLGVYPAPGLNAHQDGNEATAPVTAEVWAEHSIWPQDPSFARALGSGVTTMLILPGSANLIGGRGVTVKNVPARTMQAMKFPGAPHALKMACGENPKRVYGDRDRAPSTRMGNVAGYRQAFADAVNYRQKWEDYRHKLAAGEKVEQPPARDLKLETLVGVLEGKILVHNHCYRADEMAIMLDIAREFGYHISAFHHAVEAYKIADLLAQNQVCAAMWADWWGFKAEAYDAVRENIAMVDRAGGCAIVHSDSAELMQHLNQEAAKVMAAAKRVGIEIPREHAIRWLTQNPAQALGIADQTGSLEPGKMADVVLWSGDPFSVYTRADQVFIDGALVYDRHDPQHQPVTDFELGILGSEMEVR